MLKNIPSLKLTCPLKIQLPERKGSYSNLPFSGANWLLVSRGNILFHRDVPDPFEPLPSGLLHRYHIGWMEAKYHYLQCPEEASTMPWLGHGTYHSGFGQTAGIMDTMDTMGVILTFAPKMDMYVTTMSPCPFSLAICMHFIFSFKSSEGHAKSLVWEFQHSKAWPLCQFQFGETFLQCHFQQAFVTPNPSDTSKKLIRMCHCQEMIPKIHTIHQKTDGE